MIKKKILLILIIGILGMFPYIVGCVNLERGYPEKRYFILDASRDEDISSPDTGKVLTVRRFRVSPKYEGKGLVYRLEELSYESDFYNEFFISPASMFTEEIRKRLAGTGLFKHVIDPSSLLDSTYILEGAVTALYGDYRVNTAPKAVMEIQFFLLHETDSNPKIIFQSQYHKEEPLKGNTPDALVMSWNTALNQILTEFESDLKNNVLKVKR
jgi:cholesterol transport system auxiliary component